MDTRKMLQAYAAAVRKPPDPRVAKLRLPVLLGWAAISRLSGSEVTQGVPPAWPRRAPAAAAVSRCADVLQLVRFARARPPNWTQRAMLNFCTLADS